LLLTAAGLKAHQLATQPVLGAGFLNSRWFVIAVVEFEVLFGLWLLAGLAPRCSWRCAVLLFSAFAVVSAHKALRGDVACGCFGRVQVNPWQTLALDVGVVLALLRWQPVEHRPASVRPIGARLACLVVIWVAIGLPAGLMLHAASPGCLNEMGRFTTAARSYCLSLIGGWASPCRCWS
jgi:uncharacterized membrane protein YphA (DoxX/SURF4 family)